MSLEETMFRVAPAPSENALLSKSTSPTAAAPPAAATATMSFMNNEFRNATSFGTAPSTAVFFFKQKTAYEVTR